MENNFLDTIVQLDKQVLILLNSLGTENWDSFWMFITKQFNWIPLFIVILGVLFYKLGIKKAIFTLLFLVVLIAFSDQLTNLVKHLTGRTRPCNVPELQEFLRQFSYKPRGKSFWSGHAFVSTTFTTFIILLLRSYTRVIYFLIIFPILFAYSRVYLGVHFPVDVVTGAIMGIIFGNIFYKLYKLLYSKVFKSLLK